MFTVNQQEWLETIKNEISNNISVTTEDFNYGTLLGKGGIGGAYEVFVDKLNGVIEEMNEVLV